MVGMAAAGVLAAQPANAGYAIEIHVLDRSGTRPVQYPSRAVLTEEAFKIDTGRALGYPSDFLCRRGDAVYLVNHAEHRYVSMELGTLDGASQMLRNAGSVFAAAMDKLKGGQAPGGGEVSTEKTDQRRQISNLPCQLYVIRQGGRIVQEAWVAPWNQVSMPRQTFDLARTVGASWSVISVTAGAAMRTTLPLEGLLGIDGYPVLLRQMGRGGAILEVRLEAPKTVKTSPADFQLPVNYTRSVTI